MIEQGKIVNWLVDEEKALNSNAPGSFERLPSLKLEDGVVTEFEVVISDKPFEKYTDIETGTVKKIIPVLKDGVKHNFWLNVKNPTYRMMVQLLAAGQRKFKVLRTGKAKATKYQIIKG